MFAGQGRVRECAVRVCVVVALCGVSIPVAETVSNAAPVVTVSPSTITYTDTSGNDGFTEVRGTATSSSQVTISGGSQSLPNPPNTAVVFYTSGKVGNYGTLWIQDSGAWLYEPNIAAVNGATSTVTDTFTLQATDGSGTGSENLVVTVNGVEDTPSVTVATKSVADITDDLSVTTPCATYAGVGDPYQIDSGSSPGSETCNLAFDNSTGTKYLNFGKTSASLLIDLRRAWTITAVGLTTANDATARDPTGFELWGSNESTTSGLTLLKSVTGLAAPNDRYSAYPDTDVSGAGSYRYYKLRFSELKSDGGANSVQISEIRLKGFTGPSSYTEGDPAMPIEPTLLLADDNTASATVTLTNGYVSGDQLGFVNNGSSMGTVAGSWDVATRKLSLTGTATVAQWQNVLRAVTFVTTNPDPTSVASSRTVQWSITDSASGNVTADSTFSVIAINSAPVLGGAAPLAVSTSTTTAIGSGLTVSDIDSGNLNGGVLTVSGATTGDVVATPGSVSGTSGAIQTSGTSIQRHDGSSWVTIGSVSGGSAATYAVTFTSDIVTPSVAQDVLRAVTLAVDSTSRTRTLKVTLSDGDGGTSNEASIPVTSSNGVAASLSLQSSSDSGSSSTDRITNANPLVYDLVFSTSISGLEGGDFQFSGTGSSGCGATPSGDTAPVTVTVTGCGAGTVTMSLKASSVVAADNAALTNELVSAPQVTIDRTAPTITLSTTTADPSTSTEIDFVVSAGEKLDCTTVSSADFTFTNLVGIGAVTASGNDCVFQGTSSIAPGASGISGITKSATFSVTDFAGNAKVTATGSPSVTVDRQVPSVVSAALTSSSDTGFSSADKLTKASALQFNVTYSEEVLGIEGTDFRNVGSATGCEFAVSGSQATSVTVTATSCGEGTVILAVRPASVSGTNGEGPVSEYTGSTVTVDRSGPTVSSFSPADDSVGVARGANLSVTFNEVVRKNSGNVIVYGPASSAFETVAITSGNVSGAGTATITVNPTSDLGAGGNYYVTFAADTLRDNAGNSFAGIASSTTWNFRTMDNVAPASSVSIAATEVSSTSVTLSYTASDEGGLSLVTAYYSSAADLSSPVNCGQTESAATSGTVVCTIPDVLGAYYFYSRATDSAGNVETGPGSADDSVTYVDQFPVSSATAPATTRSRDITVTWSATDNGTVTSLVVYYSAAVNLSAPVACATIAAPAATGSTSCRLPASQATYYVFTRATDNRDQTETAPGSADATVVFANTTPVSSLTSPATTSTRRITVNFSASDDGSVDLVTAYYSTSASLTSPTSCGSKSNPSGTGTLTCTLPVTPGTYYLYSRATDETGIVESVPGSADDSVVYTNARPTSAVTGPSTSTSRAVSLSYTASDDGVVSVVTVYYSTTSGLTSPTSCGSVTNPNAQSSVTCTLPNSSGTYHVWSVATDDQDREESDPASADLTISLNLTTATGTTSTTAAPATAPVVVDPAPTGGGGSGTGEGATTPALAPATTAALRSATTVTPQQRVRVPTTTSTTTTTTTTTLPPSDAAPMVQVGEAAAVADGEQVDVVVTRENNSMRLSAGAIGAVIKPLDKKGIPIGLDPDGNIRLTPQAQVEIQIYGFKANSTAEAWLFSTPTRLGIAVTDAQGKVSKVFAMPKKAAKGAHRIVLMGQDPDDKNVKFALGIVVVEPPKSAGKTVIIVLIVVATGLALFIPPVRRRRRREKNSALSLY